ncbi:MAG: sensor histidine kinase [Candidatus Promineifilaceae bacterium]
MVRLAESDRQRILLELLISLQHAADLETVLARLLGSVTGEMGYQCALVTVVDRERNALFPWLKQEAGKEAAELLKPPDVSLDDRNHPLIQTLVKTSPEEMALDSGVPMPHALVMPLHWGATPIGLLAVNLAGQESDAQRKEMLALIGEQVAVTIGMMQTRHRLAKESAVREERARLALDLHDTVSQSLFGLVYALQACLRMLPEDPAAIEPELAWALQTAEGVRRTIRDTVRDLWPVELTAEQFETDLRGYAADILQAAELDIEFDVRGDFSSLSPPVRRSIYRISQEALANIVHHAGARESRICVDVANGRVQFIVRDNGRGFDPGAVLSQSFSKDHFGLRGMQERAAALGGSCRIYSQPDAGTSIIIDIPANAQEHH